MKIELLQEKWFFYNRFICKEGWVDICRTDQASNPNNEQESEMQLNSIVSWYRVNSSEWIPCKNIINVLNSVCAFGDECSALEIYNSYLTVKPNNGTE